jgi:hypothetical protein
MSVASIMDVPMPRLSDSMEEATGAEGGEFLARLEALLEEPLGLAP